MAWDKNDRNAQWSRESFELSFGNLNIIFTFPGRARESNEGYACNCQNIRRRRLTETAWQEGTGNAAPNSFALCIQMCAGSVTFDGSSLSLRTAYCVRECLGAMCVPALFFWHTPPRFDKDLFLRHTCVTCHGNDEKVFNHYTKTSEFLESKPTPAES